MFPISGFSPQLPSQGISQKDVNDSSQQETEITKKEKLSKDEFLPSEEFVPKDALGKQNRKNLYFNISDKGALVKEDLKNMFFIKKKTDHFNIYFPPDTEAQRDIDSIAVKREEAFENISCFFNVSVSAKIEIYIFPSDRESYCPTWNKTFAGRAIPDAQMVGLAYFEDEQSYEKIHYGHEITHLLEYFFLSENMRVPPFLREGIADYLSQSNDDMHNRMIGFLNIGLIKSPFEMNDEKINSPEYMESGSFVKLIIDKFGKEIFLNLYNEMAVLSKDEKMTQSDFSNILSETLGLTLPAFENMWKEELKTYSKPLKQCQSEISSEELIKLFDTMDNAVKTGDSGLILRFYSNDFYHMSKEMEHNIIKKHIESAKNYKTESIELFDLGTWCYGKTIAVKSKRHKSDTKEPSVKKEEKRFYLLEKLWGEWRFNARFPGGW